MSMSKRKIIYTYLEKIFSEAGYWVTKCHKSRIYILAMLWVACTQIATAKGKSPKSIYRCFEVICSRTLRGTRFEPKKVRTIWEHALHGEDWENSDHVESVKVCPCCGHELPEGLIVSHELKEIDIAERAGFDRDTNFTTFEENEQKSIQCK